MDSYALRDWFTRGRVITLILLVTLLLGAALGARPAWRAVKTWRAHRFAAEGEALLEQGRLETALLKARQAVQLSPADLRSQRLMARTLGRIPHPQALPFWLEVLKSPQATTADRLEAITAALRSQAWEVAREQLQIALGRPPVPAQAYRLASDYYAAQGDLKQGVHFARQALQAAPTDGTNILFVAQRLLLAQSPAEQAEARALLDAHAREPVATGAEALVLLATRFKTSADELDAVIARLRAHPGRTLPQEFFTYDLELKLRPNTRSNIVAAARRLHAQGSEDALLELCRWLNRHGEHAAVIEHLPLPRALQSQALYLVHLDALAGLGRWADVEAALDAPGAPLDPFYLTLYKVRSQMEQGRAELASLNWTVAYNRAADNPEQILYLAQYAERIGAVNEALRAYRRATELLPQHRPALLALLRLTEKTGGTRDVRDVLALFTQRFPEDASAQNDHAYFNLLLGENLESARQIAEMLVRAQPEMLAFRITLALAELRLQRGQEAARWLTGLQLDWGQVRPAWRVVYAAALHASGDTAGAKRQLASVPLQDLRPEERALIPKL